MKQKRTEFTLFKVRLDKPDHEAINVGRKLAHETKCQRDFAAYREAVAKGERKPKKFRFKFEGAMIKGLTADLENQQDRRPYA